MGRTVNWENNYEKALERAKNENKFVVLDFFNPN